MIQMQRQKLKLPVVNRRRSEIYVGGWRVEYCGEEGITMASHEPHPKTSLGLH